jgi:hypothetical protein
MNITDLPDRIQAMLVVDDLTGCWIWTGYRLKGGYGQVKYQGTNYLAHRLVRHLLIGDIAPKTTDRKLDTIDHLCENPSCVNPNHLDPVTQRENSYRNPDYWGNRTHCPRGHPYDMVNSTTGARMCRTCHRAFGRETQRRQRMRQS